MTRRSQPHRRTYRSLTSRQMEDHFRDQLAYGHPATYSHGDWTLQLRRLTLNDGTNPFWSAHLEVYLPWVQPRGARLRLPCWLLEEELRPSTEMIRRSLHLGWSLTRAVHWANTERRPAWAPNHYGSRTPSTGLRRVPNGRALLQALHDIEASTDDTLTAAGALIHNWTGTWQELRDTAIAIGENT